MPSGVAGANEKWAGTGGLPLLWQRPAKADRQEWLSYLRRGWKRGQTGRSVLHAALKRGATGAQRAAPLRAFDGEGYGVAAAEAEGGDAALEVAAVEFMEQRD